MGMNKFRERNGCIGVEWKRFNGLRNKWRHAWHGKWVYTWVRMIRVGT